MAARVIVVGGGLSGMSAAHTVLQAGGNVLVLDKCPFNGGNSTKATSGINAAGTTSQRALNIPDSPEVFADDTTRSAGGGAQPHLIRTLTHLSGPAIEWLKNDFKLDLSVVSRLAAHSNPRTHRGASGGQFPGMMITYALMETLEAIADDPTDGRAEIINRATVHKLIQQPDGKVVGVEYTDADGNNHHELGPVIICTGGFGADFTSGSLLAQVQQKWLEAPAWQEGYIHARQVKPPVRAMACVCERGCASVRARACERAGRQPGNHSRQASVKAQRAAASAKAVAKDGVVPDHWRKQKGTQPWYTMSTVHPWRP